jgi:putative solute:sodium symporter small subunit
MANRDDYDGNKNISFFKPRGKSMRGEVRVIKMVLAGWLAAIVVSQILVYLLEVNYSELLLNELTFFNLPIHFWLTGQFLPLWFIILCVAFNIRMDRNAARSLDGSLRFTARGSIREGDE